jgi:hypothetical protein
VPRGSALRIASVRGLEKLVRYILRPPLCLGRLGLTDEGQVTYRLAKADKKGRTVVVMSPMELMARLSALMPAPRFALRRCFGLLASGAKRRAEVVPHKKVTPCRHDHGDNSPPPKRPPTLVPWRDLLQRIGGISALECPNCLATMVPIALIQDPEGVTRYLAHLGEATQGPAAARAPPAEDVA